MLDTPDNHGACLIHYLIALNETEMIDFLCKYGADTNLKVVHTNYSPLMIAAARGLQQAYQILLSHGA